MNILVYKVKKTVKWLAKKPYNKVTQFCSTERRYTEQLSTHTWLIFWPPWWQFIDTESLPISHSNFSSIFAFIFCVTECPQIHISPTNNENWAQNCELNPGLIFNSWMTMIRI